MPQAAACRRRRRRRERSFADASFSARLFSRARFIATPRGDIEDGVFVRCRVAVARGAMRF